MRLSEGRNREKIELEKRLPGRYFWVPMLPFWADSGRVAGNWGETKCNKN